jgi:hypothetical protein
VPPALVDQGRDGEQARCQNRQEQTPYCAPETVARLEAPEQAGAPFSAYVLTNSPKRLRMRWNAGLAVEADYGRGGTAG